MAQTLEQYHVRRAMLISHLGGACVDCGSRENLEFDHVDPEEKSFTISERMSYSLSSLMAELKKCQLLCEPCHLKKTREIDGIKAEHGKYSMYRHHKCRCGPCKEANRQQVAEWRARKNAA